METATHTPGREHGLDALRVFAFLVLIFYHTGMMFVTWGWHIENAEKSRVLESVMLFFNRWRLPLLFFISGAGVAFSLRKRGLGTFAGERWRRLGIPLLFSIFVVVPPQIYFEHLFRGRRYESYASFYPQVFEFKSYPQGATSWHHMWFVAYILVFSLALLPILAWLRSAPGRAAIGRFAETLERRPVMVYLVNIPSLLIGILLGPHWPTTHNLIHDWANLTGSMVTFLWGFIFASDVRLLDLLQRRRTEFLTGGILVAAVFYMVRETGMPAWLPTDGRLVLNNVISGYFGMCWLFTLIGHARAWVTRTSPGLVYATEAVHPFYIAHQTITVAAGYYIIQWPLPIGAKLAAAAAATFLGSWITFELVRRTAATRLLFGLKT
jgi:surface polysaccharide O-acyltransferase-like enzyme